MREDELFRAYGLDPKLPVNRVRCASPKCQNKVEVVSASIFCDACYKRLMDRLGDG